ncbi:hypothetical protein ACR2XN_28710 [Klebsiella pneumoniae]
MEKQFILEGNSGSKIELNEVQETQTTTVQEETPVQTEQPSVEHPIRRSERVSRQPERYYGLVIENDKELSFIDDDEPMTYHEAMSSVDSEKWIKDNSEYVGKFDAKAFDGIFLGYSLDRIAYKVYVVDRSIAIEP